jgi:co-chaperonin GroES (HSP10)
MTLGGGDALARGAKSANFSTGGASVDDEVVLNPSVVAPEEETFGLNVVDKRRSYIDILSDAPKVAEQETKEFPDKQYEPMRPILDRLLVMRVASNPDEEVLEDGSVRNKKTGFIIPQQYRQHTNQGIVLAAGDFVVMGTVKIPLSSIVRAGDRVYYGDYNSELFPMDEQTIRGMCRKLRVNYEHSEAGLRLVRVQDIRGVEVPSERE